MKNDLFWKFTITPEMREWAEQHKSKIESQYLDDMRSVWIEFCNHFNTQWNFDFWGNEDVILIYTAYIKKVKRTEIIMDEIRRETIDEFLECIEDMENSIISREWMKIYTVLEHIYTDNKINVFNYSNMENAKEWLKELIDYYKKNYSELFENESFYSISDDYFYLGNDNEDIVVIELFENELDKNIF